MQTGRRNPSDVSTGQETPTMSSKPPEAGAQAWDRSFLSPSSGSMALLASRSQTSDLQSCDTMHFRRLRPSVVPCYGTHRKLMCTSQPTRNLKPETRESSYPISPSSLKHRMQSPRSASPALSCPAFAHGLVLLPGAFG